ncbi:MAG: FAD:protein FMN transferase, partial [Eubacteriales bacterium]|nr:FAD:protein FMN transferase [Eubacteriales bacterium]
NAKYAEELFFKYHRLFDGYNEYEDTVNVYSINRLASKKTVKVPEELFNLLSLCKEEQLKLNNTLNIAMGTVLKLWHDAREFSLENPKEAYIPAIEDLFEASKHTDMDDVVLNANDNTVFFKDPDLQLNVGAVAKGYATELVAQALLKSDMPSFIINAGGNVRTGHPPLDGRDNWGVGLQDPDNTSQVFETLFLHDKSVVTSGDYQRFFEVDGKKYHHIISPDTLLPANAMRSVTIVTEDSALADMLSTALFIMPFEEGYKFIKERPDVGVVWYLTDGTIVITDNLKKTVGSLM